MKVSELSGALLDYWVAKCEKREARIAEYTDDNRYCVVPAGICSELGWTSQSMYSPSTAWSIAGPLIERAHIGFTTGFSDSEWCAAIDLNAHTHFDGGVLDGKHFVTGPTPLVAAMRVYVASKFGEEVPDEVPS